MTDVTKNVTSYAKQAAAVGFETMSGGRVRVRPDSAERASNTANSIGFHAPCRKLTVHEANFLVFRLQKLLSLLQNYSMKIWKRKRNVSLLIFT